MYGPAVGSPSAFVAHLLVRSRNQLNDHQQKSHPLQELHRPFHRHDMLSHRLRIYIEPLVLEILGKLQDLLRYLIQNLQPKH